MAITSTIRATVDRLRASGGAGEQIWGLGLELTTLASTLLAFTLLGRSLGATGYGGYAALYAIIGPLVTLSASGVTLSLLQHVVRDREPLPETARSCLSLSIVLGTLLTVVGGAVAFWIVDTLSAVAIVSILVIEFVSTPLVNVAASTVQAGTSFTGAAQIRIALVGGRIVILVALFVADSLTVASLGVTQLAWSAVLSVFALRAVGRRYGFRFWPGAVKGRHLKSNVIYSAAISADSVANQGDQVVLAANRMVTDTGLYAAAFRIINLGLVPVGSLTNVSHKRFLENDEDLPGEHLHLAIRYSKVSGLYGIAFGVAAALAAPLFPLLMGDTFEGSVTMIRWLAPVVFLRAIGIFSLNGLMGLGRAGLRTVLITVNAAIGVALYVILIPRYGWEGAAIGTLLCETQQVVMTWVALVICQRRFDRGLDRRDPDPDDVLDVPISPIGDAP